MFQLRQIISRKMVLPLKLHIAVERVVISRLVSLWSTKPVLIPWFLQVNRTVRPGNADGHSTTLNASVTASRAKSYHDWKYYCTTHGSKAWSTRVLRSYDTEGNPKSKTARKVWNLHDVMRDNLLNGFVFKILRYETLGGAHQVFLAQLGHSTETSHKGIISIPETVSNL